MTTQMILALDIGTTGIKACLYDAQGTLAGRVYQKVDSVYPHPGWVEQDPKALWRLTLEAMGQVVQQSGRSWPEVAALGLTNQRETVIAWDRTTGEPLYNAIVWQCRRTADACAEKAQDPNFVSMVKAKTGLAVDAYFSASKMAWILEHVPEAKALHDQNRLCLGTVDSWILWNLCRDHPFVTDWTNASRTMGFDIAQKRWEETLLSPWGIPPEALAQPLPSKSIFGETNPSLTGGSTIPVLAVLGDQQAALFGEGCWEPGSAKTTLGTGAFVMCQTGREPVRVDGGILTTLAVNVQGESTYALEGAVFMAGATLEWLKNQLGLFQSFDEAVALAQSVPDSGGVVLVPAFVGLGAPHWNSTARGLISGLTQGTTRAHLVRAAYDSTAYQVKDVVDVMQTALPTPMTHMAVDGGVSQADFVMTLLAEALAMPLLRLVDPDLTAKGVALLAGLAAGVYTPTQLTQQATQGAQQFEPSSALGPECPQPTPWAVALQQVLHP